jgi:serine protease Do
MISPGGYLPLVIALLFFSSEPCFAEPVSVGVYPVPVVEMKELVTDWLQGEGCMIVREVPDDGGVSLECEKARQAFRVRIEPRSPVASIVRIESRSGYVNEDETTVGLREFLASRTGRENAQRRPEYRGVPPKVELNESAVFCLRASSRGVPVGFSGFAIDRRGFIISTAHDLEGIRRVTVGLKNGIQAAGEVVWRDVRQDLSLIRVKTNFGAIVSLGNGRRSPRVGEPVFLLSCVTEGREGVRFGTVGEKPAMVNGQPLWQVNLHVSPGTSGSPVFDSDGRLVGMVKGRFRGTGTRGFLIPLDTIRDFLRKGGQ